MDQESKGLVQRSRPQDIAKKKDPAEKEQPFFCEGKEEKKSKFSLGGDCIT